MKSLFLCFSFLLLACSNQLELRQSPAANQSSTFIPSPPHADAQALAESKLETPTPAEMDADKLTCDSVDAFGMRGQLFYHFDSGLISYRASGSESDQIIFGEGYACGYKSDGGEVKCASNVPDSKDFISKRLTCKVTPAPGPGHYPLTAGDFKIQLESGEGSLRCTVFQELNYALTLKNCKSARK